MSDDLSPGRTPGIRVAFWVGLGTVLLAAAVFGTGKRRAGAPASGDETPDAEPDAPAVETEVPLVAAAVEHGVVAHAAPQEPANTLEESVGDLLSEAQALAVRAAEDEEFSAEQDIEAPDEAPEELAIESETAEPETDSETEEPTDEAAPKPKRGGKRKRTTGGRVAFWIGIAMILAGIGLLGYVAWQLWGTNWASHRQQREITQNLQQEWEQSPVGCTENCPTGQATALLRIPKFGRDYVVPVLEGVTPEVLSKGFGHFKESADPGEVGNYALAGHRVTHGEPLRKMPQLRPGDEVIVETRNTTFTYVLDTNPNALIVPFTSVWVVSPLPKNPRAGGPQPGQEPGQRLITLTTCSEIFHTDNRMVSFGHLVREVPKT